MKILTVSEPSRSACGLAAGLLPASLQLEDTCVPCQSGTEPQQEGLAGSFFCPTITVRNFNNTKGASFTQRCTWGLVLLPTGQGSAAGSSPPRCSRPREAQLHLDGNIYNCVQHQGMWQMLTCRNEPLYIVNCVRGYFIICVLSEEEN